MSNINMSNLNFKNLSPKEYSGIIEPLAKERSVKGYEQMTDEERLSKIEKNPQKQNNQQQIISKNKERIEIISSEFKELGYKLLRDELKEIKRRLYMVENKRVH